MPKCLTEQELFEFFRDEHILHEGIIKDFIVKLSKTSSEKIKKYVIHKYKIVMDAKSSGEQKMKDAGINPKPINSIIKTIVEKHSQLLYP